MLLPRITARSLAIWGLLLVASVAAAATDIEVVFSPHGGVARTIAAKIDSATSSAFVMAFTISEPQIVQALIRAHERGIAVRIITDRAQERSKTSAAHELNNRGLQIRSNHQYTRFHNKVVILDGETVCTGSANFSKSGDRSNAENVVILRVPEVAAKFCENFAYHWDGSKPFISRTATR